MRCIGERNERRRIRSRAFDVGTIYGVVVVALLAALGSLVWCYGLQNHLADTQKQLDGHYAEECRPGGEAGGDQRQAAGDQRDAGPERRHHAEAD